MWKKKPKYTLNDPITKIENHRFLPEDCKVLASFKRTEASFIQLVKNREFLSILWVSDRVLPNGSAKYICSQTDVSLGFLEWFPKALKNFIRPPAEGGLHAGGMITQDENVDGEMLCITRTVCPPGYELKNRTRWDWDDLGTNIFNSQSISLDEEILFEGGLLEWMESGEWKKHI